MSRFDGTGTDREALKTLIADAGLPADRVVIRDVGAIGHGNTSDVVRLSLDWAGQDAGGSGDLPRSLIAKLPRTLPNGEYPSADLFGYGREVSSYRYFGARPSFRIPHCYLAETHEDGFVLLLEDMDADCRPGDQVGGCSLDDAWAVVRELAALHAAYWKSPELAAMDWPVRRWTRADASAAMYAEGAREMRARYTKALGEAAIGVIEAMVPLTHDWIAARPSFPTLIHGDARVDNIIFEDGSDGTRACLIDLQSIMIGEGAFDIAYHLTGSIDPVERAAHEREMVAWHAAQIRAVDPSYDDETAWRLYCENAVSGMISTICAAAVLPGGPHVDKLLVALASRNCAAVADVDGIAAAARRAGR